jgi:predicted metal-binding membrane protein
LRIHPEWWIYLFAACAWLPLVVPGGGHGAMPVGMDLGSMPSMTPDLGHQLVGAVLMSVAMMAPLAAPVARYVALAGRVNRRVRGPLVFVATYIGVWSAVALVLTLAAGALARVAGPFPVLFLAVTAAVAWQLTQARRHALARCARSEPMGGRGWRADLACARFALAAARDCVLLCGGLMAVVVASDHAAPVLALAFVLQVRERSDRRYDPRSGAAVIAAMGVAVALASLVVGPAGEVFAGSPATGSAAGDAQPGSGSVAREQVVEGRSTALICRTTPVEASAEESRAGD